ncbi:MAG: NTP transferase domain-containing protein [Thermoleophilia bacterium]|nr:NTP transferase domain-containing protein [Thermoleophilia bacterium]
MTRDIVVMAAGEGTRLRPLTERWAKPVLPIDGRPVLATLLRELAGAGLERVWLVSGHLAGQVERLAGDGSAFALDVRHVRQRRPAGAAQAVACAMEAGAEPPFLVSAADTVYTPGDVGRFADAFAVSEAAGAIAIRPRLQREHHVFVRVEQGRIVRVPDASASGEVTAGPLMAAAEPVARTLVAVCAPPYRPPYDVAQAYQAAIDEGHAIAAIEIGPTRDLTTPLDLVEENFPYLRGL